jgi:hypothetical protein
MHMIEKSYLNAIWELNLCRCISKSRNCVYKLCNLQRYKTEVTVVSWKWYKTIWTVLNI